MNAPMQYDLWVLVIENASVGHNQHRKPCVSCLPVAVDTPSSCEEE